MVAFFHAANGDKVPFYPDAGDRILSGPEVVKALLWKCRFNGHIPRWWSVLAHSTLVAHECHRRATAMRLSRRSANLLALAGLCHDMGEAVIGDITSPQKRIIGRDCALWEVEDYHAKQFFHEAIAHQRTHYEVEGLHPLDHPLVKRVDQDAVVTEFIEIFGLSRERASTYGGEWIESMAAHVAVANRPNIVNQMEFDSNWFEHTLAQYHGRLW